MALGFSKVVEFFPSGAWAVSEGWFQPTTGE
jgi:hypothetical protein